MECPVSIFGFLNKIIRYKSHVMAGVEMSPSTNSEDASNTIKQNDAEAFGSELTGIVTRRQRHRV